MHSYRTVLSEMQCGVAIQRNGGIDYGAAIGHEIMGQVGAPPAEADPNRGARACIDEPRSRQREIVATDNADKPGLIIDQRHQLYSMVKKLQDRFPRSLLAYNDTLAIHAVGDLVF